MERVGGRSPPDAEGFLPLSGRAAMRIPHQPRRPQPRPSRRFPHLVSLPPAHVLLPSCPSPWGGGAPTGCRISPAARGPPHAVPTGTRGAPLAPPRPRAGTERLHSPHPIDPHAPAGAFTRQRSSVPKARPARDEFHVLVTRSAAPRRCGAVHERQPRQGRSNRTPPSRPELGCGEARSREGGELVPCRTGRVG